MPVSLTRTVSFQATHRYFKPEWSAGENRSRFGWTADEPGHGHQYRCSVTVSGPTDPATDMILDLPVLDAILASEVTERLQGKALHLDLPEFAPGARLPAGVRLERVRIAEDATLHADCTGPA